MRNVVRALPGWINRYFRDAEGELYAIHIRPLDDLKLHVYDGCWCQPTESLENGVLIYTHHSMDGRELIERHGLQ